MDIEHTDSNIEYQENFTKVILESSYNYVINAIKEVHNEENGWELGNIQTERVDDRQIRITVPLIKRKKERTK